MSIYFYGPPGSGKSTIGRLFAQALELPFWDLDQEVQAGSGKTIPEIFSAEGEAGFRRREREALEGLLAGRESVIALGGGALLDVPLRAAVQENGQVICLAAPVETLAQRLYADAQQRGEQARRPLVSTAGQESGLEYLQGKLNDLLDRRAAHYATFACQLDTRSGTPEQLAWEAQIALGRFRVSGMGPAYDVLVSDALSQMGALLAERGLRGPVMVVSDENVARFYLRPVLEALRGANYEAHSTVLPPGESHKTIDTVQRLWEAYLQAGLERSSTVLSLGGGVVGDLAGFSAATYLRGVAWVNLPTTLLAMVDAGLGGKTGADLPQGKNLVGAFHPPRLVLAAPAMLATLPEPELRSGMAEVVKHGVIGDPRLFDLCSKGWSAIQADLDQVVRRGMAVKIQVIVDDPYERGRRAALNLGHTFGHALEQVSGYRLRHGEGVAIGMVAAARLAERLGVGTPGVAGEIQGALQGLGLPVEIPADLDRGRILQAMGVDKKKQGGRVRFVLPVRVGEVRTGFVIDDMGWLAQV